MGESANECNVLFYFVPFVFFVDELPFLVSKQHAFDAAVIRFLHVVFQPVFPE
jgi:hypothetical protein